MKIAVTGGQGGFGRVVVREERRAQLRTRERAACVGRARGLGACGTHPLARVTTSRAGSVR